jgi:hypothetical protein
LGKSDDDVMKRKTRKTRLASACRPYAAAVFTHTTPDPLTVDLAGHTHSRATRREPTSC